MPIQLRPAERPGWSRTKSQATQAWVLESRSRLLLSRLYYNETLVSDRLRDPYEQTIFLIWLLQSLKSIG